MELISTATGQAQNVSALENYTTEKSYSPVINGEESAATTFDFFECDSAYMGHTSNSNNS